MKSELSIALGASPINGKLRNATSHPRASLMLVLTAFFKRENLLAAAIIFIASSLSPFALADAGVIPHQFFYLALMPFLLLYVFTRSPIRINLLVGLILGSQITVIFLVSLVDGLDRLDSHWRTIGTLLSIGVISVMFRSNLLDIRVFVNVAVIFTLGILLSSALSFVAAYLGYLSPDPSFSRSSQTVFQVGYTFTSEVYPAGLGYFIRPGGVFIEPGQLAMHASLAIIANAVVLRNQKHELLLIFLGLFTTSLAFYLFLVAFFILFGRRKALVLYIVAFLAAILVAGGPAMIKEDLVLDHILGRTLSFFTDGLGGNRAASTWGVVSNLQELKMLGGANWGAFEGQFPDATVFGPFLTYGIIGGIFPYLHVLLFAAVPVLVRLAKTSAGTVRTNMMAIFLLLTLNLFQRPFTLHFLYYVYLVAMFEWELRKYAIGRMTPEAVHSPTRIESMAFRAGLHPKRQGLPSTGINTS